MLIELSDLGGQIECDTCIVGAGAAGISVAMELLDSGIDVVMLESGGRQPNPAVQALNRGTHAGAERRALTSTRLRYFGGTTNHWTGLVAPLSNHDFDRLGVGQLPGWPLSSADMAPYYERALAFIGHSGRTFDETLTDELARCPFAFDRTKIAQTFLHYSAALRFGAHFAEALENASNVRVVLNATATSLETDDGGVRRVNVSNLQAETATVTARRFVLACGAIENARILLHAAYGVDASALLGRCLMDHPSGPCGEVIQTGRTALGEVFHDFIAGADKYRPVLSLPAALLAEKPNASCYLWPSARPDLRTRLQSALRASDMERAMRDIDQSSPVADPPCGRFDGEARVQIMAVLEQVPDRNNRIVLGNNRDALGVPLPHLEWRIGESERRSLLTLLTTLGAELGRLAVGRVRLAEWLLQDPPEPGRHLRDYNHPMGCTRMATSEDHGVVDTNCRVFGTDNLYVAGASVFATGGIHNPTLTIIALALRLANHLKRTADK